ncbi:aminotransferase class V-fold PLP-dependent enzyme [Salicibibacter halophilus]|uniref:Aminotransferase class V-fold PLP-dependent enzyme n=1 Tax=Salicibibacter halophilus TaxID=2502791 RepID=A0A514LEW5_9BACI|nr:aminotransferase class V-fold PLP-dependent enzyme [Salicibibacter halophilus]QDI90397.1 aminotransferase class V-fold PLP-dependent enzyme [Salicibibacter halophilus]
MTSPVLPTLTIEEAKRMQFRIVHAISRHFSGHDIFHLGDVGVHPEGMRPQTTAQVEKVMADVFETEDAGLVRGSGTGAIRVLLSALAEPGETIYIHDAPVYTTTAETLRMLGLHTAVVDYNDLGAVRKAVRKNRGKVFYIQHARQQPEDRYDLQGLIETVKNEVPELPVVTDDNYCVLKVPAIGVELGADYSTFSGFKVLGPEGVGVIAGKHEAVDIVRGRNYSGGGQVQGPEATDFMRMMTFAPVSLAVQNEQVDILCERLNEGEVPGIHKAYVTNSQSKNVIVELEEPIAAQVIEKSAKHGAAVYPVGAESRYEILPMIYRVSGSFSKAHPALKEYGLRINPMKSDANHVIRILGNILSEG